MSDINAFNADNKNDADKTDTKKSKYDVEPLPESTRPRRDGPGGD